MRPLFFFSFDDLSYSFMPTEAKLTRYIMRDIRRKFGGKWWKIHANIFQGKDTVDIFGVCRSKFFALEVKLPGKEKQLTKIQAHTLNIINANGGFACMITSRKQAIKFVRGALKS